ncbi:hypothetical protein [Amycolatopsis sp. NPDC058986]|uniref:hypothetical protein n=1 Tax=unclassified Amycolatopsis TaxID=2618356 RepID=UPI00366FCE44
MSALIYVDLAHLHPVVDGVWHRAWLTHLPAPGEGVAMLCGLVATAEYCDRLDRDTHGVPVQCWDCEREYRAELGYSPPPGGYPTASHRPVPYPRA